MIKFARDFVYYAVCEVVNLCFAHGVHTWQPSDMTDATSIGYT